MGFLMGKPGWARFLLVIVCALLVTNTAYAVTYQVTRIKDDGSPRTSGPRISGNHVVWSSDDGNDNEIYLYDIATATTTQLTSTDDYDELKPRVSGDKVVWERSGSHEKSEIILYDISSGATMQLTSNNIKDVDPEISGDKVVWYGDVGDDQEIYLYDGATVTQLTNNDYYEASPQVFGDNVVWYSAENSAVLDIYLYDGVSTELIASNGAGGADPQVSSEKVVWVGSDGDEEIYLYDIATEATVQLTDNGFDDSRVRISGDRVVWQGDDGNDGKEEVYLYDIATDTTTQLTSNDLRDVRPQVSGDNVIWMGHDGNDFEIFLYDGISTTQITDNSSDDEALQISGDTFVWRGNVESLFLATPIDHLSNGSFDTESDVDSLNIDMGFLPLNADSPSVDFEIANLLPAGAQLTNTARLDLLNLTGTGDTGVLTTDLAPFTELDAGAFMNFQAYMDTSLPGSFEATYELSFTDAVGTDQTLTLNLSGEVVLTDDPNIPDLIYNAATGEVILDPDASSIIGYTLQNTSDAFLPENFSAVLGGVSTAIPSELSEAALSNGFGSIGNVFPVGMNIAQLVELLTVNQVSTGLGAPLVPFDLIVIGETPAVPEPSTYGMAALGMLGLALCGWRRRRA